MSEVFGIFQIGPVQEFIACARKTQDFWSGSYLLSFLNCIAIDTVVQSCGENEDVIIYPSLDDQPLFSYVRGLRKSGQEPWENKPRNRELTPTIPNRFVCKLNENQALNILQQAEKAAESTFFKFAEHIKTELEVKISKWFPTANLMRHQDIWDDIWVRQTRNLFEIYWSISPLDSAKYSKSYWQAEALLGTRKAIRNFEPVKEYGYKCTLCGEREPLNAKPNGSLKRRDLREFWEKIRQTTGYRFREEEHLCAICTTKRLAPNYIFHRSADFPSTSSVTVADFVGETLMEYNTNLASFLEKGKDVVLDFVGKAKEVSKQIGLDFEVQPLPQHNTLVDKFPHLSTLTKLDGDWLIPDTYNNILKRPPTVKVNLGDVENATKALKYLVDKVKVLRREEGSVSFGPGKYYAIFQMDADSIGERIAQKQSEGEHRQFSKLLCNFSSNTVPRIVENDCLGKILYFGGDEGVAFVSLRDILLAIEECRRSFEKEITDTTVCVGVLVAHYEQPLLQVFLEVRQVIEKVKNWEKNGFCIALMKRSGGTTYAKAHWDYNGLKVVPLLQDLAEYYRSGKISDRWYYQFMAEELGLKQTRGPEIIGVNIEAAQLEISRLVRRHADMRKVNTTKLNQLIQKLKDLVSHIDNWEDFTGLMDVAVYIARGGGR